MPPYVQNKAEAQFVIDAKVTVPRRLFFTALQWIAIAQGPKIQQKNKL